MKNTTKIKTISLIMIIICLFVLFYIIYNNLNQNIIVTICFILSILFIGIYNSQEKIENYE